MAARLAEDLLCAVATTATRATGTKVTSAGQRRTPKAAKTSSVAKKVVMAVTGIIMIAYLIAHMIGNLHAFQGAQAYNDYALWLRTFGEPALPYRTILTAIEIVLSVSVIGHIWAAVSLWRQAKRARPVAVRDEEGERADLRLAHHALGRRDRRWPSSSTTCWT